MINKEKIEKDYINDQIWLYNERLKNLNELWMNIIIIKIVNIIIEDDDTLEDNEKKVVDTVKTYKPIILNRIREKAHDYEWYINKYNIYKDIFKTLGHYETITAKTVGEYNKLKKDIKNNKYKEYSCKCIYNINKYDYDIEYCELLNDKLIIQNYGIKDIHKGTIEINIKDLILLNDIQQNLKDFKNIVIETKEQIKKIDYLEDFTDLNDIYNSLTTIYIKSMLTSEKIEKFKNGR